MSLGEGSKHNYVLSYGVIDEEKLFTNDQLENVTTTKLKCVVKSGKEAKSVTKSPKNDVNQEREYL